VEEEVQVRVGLFGRQVSEQTFFFSLKIQPLVPYIQMLHFFGDQFSQSLLFTTKHNK